MIGGISFSATSITSGLDADKPVSPKPGYQYLATDTKILYVCYAAGVWVNAAPTIKITNFETINVVQGNTYTLKSIDKEIVTYLISKVETTVVDFSVFELKNITAVDSFTLSFESKIGNTPSQYAYYIYINDVYKYSNNDTNQSYVQKTIPFNSPLAVGDNVKIKLYLNTSAVNDYVYLRNIKFKGDITRTVKNPVMDIVFEEGFIELT